jgi:uncharacterized membrane protein YheB (UPF0754 family)
MALQLKLDAAAIAALFPEGSEQRVELQSAVIAEFVRKHIKTAALGPDITAQIERARKDALDAVSRARTDATDRALAEYGAKKSGWGNVTIEGEAKTAIATAARNEFDKLVREQLAESISKKLDSMQSDINRISELRIAQLVEKEIAAAVKAKVDSVMRGLSMGSPVAGTTS